MTTPAPTLDKDCWVKDDAGEVVSFQRMLERTAAKHLPHDQDISGVYDRHGKLVRRVSSQPQDHAVSPSVDPERIARYDWLAIGFIAGLAIGLIVLETLILFRR